jgi:beta-glucosidase
MIAKILNDAFTGGFFEFFTKGTFRFYQAGVANIVYKNKNATHSNDFFGLNYYSNDYVRMRLSVKQPFIRELPSGMKTTDMGWPIYPEGIYRAIKKVSEFGVPIIVTENGIADAKDSRRADFIKRYLYAISKAIHDGYNVKGYIYWATGKYTVLLIYLSIHSVIS